MVLWVVGVAQMFGQRGLLHLQVVDRIWLRLLESIVGEIEYETHPLELVGYLGS